MAQMEESEEYIKKGRILCGDEAFSLFSLFPYFIPHLACFLCVNSLLIHFFIMWIQMNVQFNSADENGEDYKIEDSLQHTVGSSLVVVSIWACELGKIGF